MGLNQRVIGPGWYRARAVSSAICTGSHEEPSPCAHAGGDALEWSSAHASPMTVTPVRLGGTLACAPQLVRALAGYPHARWHVGAPKEERVTIRRRAPRRRGCHRTTPGRRCPSTPLSGKGHESVCGGARAARVVVAREAEVRAARARAEAARAAAVSVAVRVWPHRRRRRPRPRRPRRRRPRRLHRATL